ncbi:MAG: DNA-deoxyinosine glycosylase [Polaromonas sp.]
MLTGLAPLVSVDTQLLILGSFPSAASLAAQQYYGHPRNQFWPILQAIWPDCACLAGADSYENRSKWLLSKRLGLWDVYAACERQGSLDSRIRQPVLNDFAQLPRDCPGLRAIAHNGSESFRHAGLIQLPGLLSLPSHRLPSTSLAHAAWSFERKLAAWRTLFDHYGLIPNR